MMVVQSDAGSERRTPGQKCCGRIDGAGRFGDDPAEREVAMNLSRQMSVDDTNSGIAQPLGKLEGLVT